VKVIDATILRLCRWMDLMSEKVPESNSAICPLPRDAA
jgi:hypothetical protein